MGHCNECGAPCPSCSARNDYTLLSLDKSIRSQIKKLLDDVGCQVQQRQDELVRMVAQYSPTSVQKALRIWRNGGYVLEGKDERYFMGILRKNSITKDPVLDDLPPCLNPDDGEED